MDKISIFTLTLFVSLTARAETFPADKLKQAVVDQDIRSIEQLLPLIPQIQRDHFAVAYQSKSFQQASLTNPRILMFGDDAKTVYAFNGDKAQRGFYQFEMREFNEATNEFEYSFILFNENRDKAVISAKNPRLCMSCHGEHPVPIFSDYSSKWPGFFVEITSDVKRPFYQQYADFVANMPTHPRYRFLNREFMSPVDFIKDHASVQPLNMFGKLEARYVGRHLAAELQKDPEFAKLKYAAMFLGATNDLFICENDRPFEDEILSVLYRVAKAKYGLEPWFPAATPDYPTALAFSYNASVEQLSKPKPFSYINPERWSDGVDNMSGHALVTLLQREAELATDLGKMVSVRPGRMDTQYSGRYTGPQSGYLDRALTFADFGAAPESACALLRAKVETEIRSVKFVR